MVAHLLPTGLTVVGYERASVTKLATHIAQREVRGIDFFEKLAAMQPVLAANMNGARAEWSSIVNP